MIKTHLRFHRILVLSVYLYNVNGGGRHFGRQSDSNLRLDCYFSSYIYFPCAIDEGKMAVNNRVLLALLTLLSGGAALAAPRVPKLSRISVDVVHEEGESCELLQLHCQRLALERRLHEASMQRRDLEHQLVSLVSQAKVISNVLESRERLSSFESRSFLDSRGQMSSDRVGQHLRLRGGVQSDPCSNTQTGCSCEIARSEP